jgi:hypothetical protein
VMFTAAFLSGLFELAPPPMGDSLTRHGRMEEAANRLYQEATPPRLPHDLISMLADERVERRGAALSTVYAAVACPHDGRSGSRSGAARRPARGIGGRSTGPGDGGRAPSHPVIGEKKWSRHSDLNRGPAVYETAALPLSYVGSAASLATPFRAWIRASGVNPRQARAMSRSLHVRPVDHPARVCVDHYVEIVRDTWRDANRGNWPLHVDVVPADQPDGDTIGNQGVTPRVRWRVDQDNQERLRVGIEVARLNRSLCRACGADRAGALVSAREPDLAEALDISRQVCRGSEERTGDIARRLADSICEYLPDVCGLAFPSASRFE